MSDTECNREIIDWARSYAATKAPPPMTLRQYAAVAAMRGIVSGPSLVSNDSTSIAKGAVQLADALIAELAKEASK